MTTEEIKRQCEFIRSTGTSSRHALPITTILELCRDAEAYRSLPEPIKEAAKFVRAGQ
jgi:type II secretory pathway component PulF